MSKLDSMAMFVRVAEPGSFSGAAREQGIARSIVNRHIAQLEDALGIRLMTRSTRRLTSGPGKALPVSVADSSQRQLLGTCTTCVKA